MFRFLLSNNHLPNILVEGIIKDTVQKGEIVCMKVNDIIHGFRLLKQDYVKECASETFEFIHVKSGARLLYFKNDDNNKVFSIAFRTPPTDNTGVPHIMEHSTLCGSRKFPLKEPFVELFTFDKVKNNFEENIYSLNDKLPKVDAVVITPFYAFDSIRNDLKNKMDAKIVSIEEVIWSL